jgi:hypothetical protein
VQILEYLFLRPGPVGPAFDQWGGTLLGAYSGIAVCLLVLGLAMYRLNGRHGLKNWVTRRILIWGLALQFAGMLLLALRVANLAVLSMRFLLFAQLLAEVLAAAYLLRWLSTRFPDRLAVYEWEEKKRAYLPRSAGGSVEPLHRRATAGRRR